MFPVAEQCFHSNKLFSFPTLCPTASRLGMGKKVRGSAVLNYPMDISHYMMPCSAIKVQGKEKETGTLVLLMFFFPINCYTCWCCAFQEAVKHLPLNGKAVNKYFFFFLPFFLFSLCMQLLLQLLNCCYLNLWVFIFLWISPCPMGEKTEWAAVWMYGCWLVSTHCPNLGSQSEA